MISRIKQHRTILSLIVLAVLILGIVIINSIAYRSIELPNTTATVSLNSLLFLFVGILFICISAYIFIHLFQYKTCKLFFIYTLLIGLSISLVPCIFISPLLSVIETVLALGSSFFLFNTIGYMTQMHNRKLYRIFLLILLIITFCGIFAEVIQFVGIDNTWFNLYLSESANISILLCVLFSIVTMALYYSNSNGYAKKQIRVLLIGIAIGFIVFLVAYNLPYMFVVQTIPSDQPANMEILLNSSHILMFYMPLLLFSGVSAAILLMLFKREFISEESRLNILEYIFLAVYVFLSNAILILFSNLSIEIQICLNIILYIPIAMLFYRLMRRQNNSEEEAYQWNLLEELENERQELSAFLHDEVLQSIIAYYRQVQSDKTRQHEEMKEQLSKLISQIRKVSHNLYPTIVEDVGLENGIQSYVDELLADNTEIRIWYEYNIGAGVLPKSVTLTFYRIIRELIMNAVKHSECKTITVCLDEDENGFLLHVKDDGRGFALPDNETLLLSSHMGLYTLKKQIVKLQGQMSFHSNEKTGTEYYIYFPGKEVMLNGD